MQGIYLVKYTGQAGGGSAVLYIGNGVIAGADVAEAIYRGTYQEIGGRLRGKLTLTASANGGSMVTGLKAPPGASFQLDLDFPADFDNGQPQTMMGPGNLPIRVTVAKIHDLPQPSRAAA